jgi:two-component system response regulator NreC
MVAARSPQIQQVAPQLRSGFIMTNNEVHKKITLLLVDDHEVVRSGLRMLLENQPDLEIVGESNSGGSAITLAGQIQPDIILMDITLPDITGIEATRRILSAYAQTKIIALTIHEDEQYFFQMLQAGASGYVPKRAAPADLIDAIHLVYQDEIYIYPALAKLLVDDFLERAQDDISSKQTIDGLTPREQEILVAVAQGESIDEISNNLSISKHTVARHRENLMRKLGLHNRGELVKYAIRKGLIIP